MDELFHPTLYRASDYIFMLGLKFIHVNEVPGDNSSEGPTDVVFVKLYKR